METGGVTEFVPLPFVHTEIPRWRRGAAQSGPTFREDVVMDSIALLLLRSVIANIQASWVKTGLGGVAPGLQVGADELDGTLMEESVISSARGVNSTRLTPPIIQDSGK